METMEDEDFLAEIWVVRVSGGWITDGIVVSVDVLPFLKLHVTQLWHLCLEFSFERKEWLDVSSLGALLTSDGLAMKFIFPQHESNYLPEIFDFANAISRAINRINHALMR